MKLNSRGVATVVAGAAAAGYLVFLLWPKEKAAPPPVQAPVIGTSSAGSPPVTLATKPSAAPAPTDAPPPETAKTDTRPRPASRIAIKAGKPIPVIFPNQEERDRLMALAADYDPKQIPVIAPSLKHSDPTVREAARQALVQIADRAAIPFLEEAAKATRDPEEAQALREIIEFLSLPRFIDVVSSEPKADTSTP